MTDIRHSFAVDAPAASRGPDAERSFIFDAFSTVWRRKLIIGALFAAITAAAAAAVMTLPPTYSSSATILIEPKRDTVVDLVEVRSALPRDGEALANEIQVLMSRELIAEAARSAGMMDEIDRDAMVDRIRSRLVVAQEGRSRVVGISFRASEPELAAAFPNALAQTYLAQETTSRAEAAQQASAWITGRLGQLRADADAAAQEASAFRSAAGLEIGRDVTLLQQEISELGTQLTAARTRAAEVAAALDQARLARQDPASAEIGDGFASPMLQHLRIQEGEHARRVTSLLERADMSHPGVAAAAARLDTVREEIAREIGRIIGGLEVDHRAALQAEAALGERLTEARSRSAELGDAQARTAELEQVAEARAEVLRTFLARSVELEAQGAPQSADARLLSAAPVPTRSAGPNPAILMATATVTALGVAVVVAFALDALDRGLRGMNQLERTLGLRALGLLPRARRERDRPMLLAAAGDLLTRLLAGAKPGATTTLAVASALPGEGKTETAIALARQAADAGLRVLLVDADLRRGGMSARLGMDKTGPGLADFLLGETTVEAAIRSSDDLVILPAGRRVETPALLLARAGLVALLDEVKARYDLVIVDTAPVAAGADAGAVARLVSQTLFLVRWGRTPAASAAAAVRELLVAGARPAGAVLSMVDVRRNAAYPHADGILYSRRLRRYQAA
jgi:polysaccharide biosynthesis transport protein